MDGFKSLNQMENKWPLLLSVSVLLGRYRRCRVSDFLICPSGPWDSLTACCVLKGMDAKLNRNMDGLRRVKHILLCTQVLRRRNIVVRSRSTWQELEAAGKEPPMIRAIEVATCIGSGHNSGNVVIVPSRTKT